MDDKDLASALLNLMGGGENIVSLTHCATRLRPELRDRSLVKAREIEALEGVSGVVDNEASFQVIIGLGVGKVYDAMLGLMRREGSGSGGGLISTARSAATAFSKASSRRSSPSSPRCCPFLRALDLSRV